MRLPPLFPRGAWIRFAILAMVVWPGGDRPGHGQEPPADIFTVARTAAQKQELNKSEQIGFSIMKTAFNDIPPEGGILIGFDLQLSKFLDREIVHAMKP